MKSIEKTIKELVKKYGTAVESVVYSGAIPPVNVIPTGIVSFDIATGIGGIPIGKMVEVYAPEGVGKTTFALQVCKSFLEHDSRNVVYFDIEEKLDRGYAAKIAGESERFYIATGGAKNRLNAEIALNMVEGLVDSKDVSLVVIDSVAMLLPKSEDEASIGDSLPGLRARVLGQAIMKLAGRIASSGTTILFINQLRAKMNTIGFGASNETTSGGNAIKFMTAMRINMRVIKRLKLSDGTPHGQDVRFTITKNSFGKPYVSAVITLKYGKGFSHIEDIISLAVNIGLIEKSGAWFNYGEEKFHGEARMVEFLEENKDTTEKIVAAVKEAYDLVGKSEGITELDSEDTSMGSEEGDSAE